MSLAHHRLTLPESLQTQLLDFRRRVWTIKLVEAICGAVIGILIAFLATFALDRVFDTPWEVRLGIFVAAMVGCGLIPLALHRWIWRQRKLEQLARLLATSIRALATNCSASSSWFTARASKLGRRRCAKRP